MLRTLFVFFAMFRPAIWSPSIPSTIALIPVTFRYLTATGLRTFLNQSGLLLTSIFVFLLLWALTIDTFNGTLWSQGIRSQTATLARFALYAWLAHFTANKLFHGDREAAHRSFFFAVMIQASFGLLMLASAEFKYFMFQRISGYTGSEKIFRDYYLDVRFYGWSEELLYTAPAAMLLTIVNHPRINSVLLYISAGLVFVLSIINARVSVAALLLGARNGGRFVALSALLSALLMVLFIFFADNSRVSTISAYLFSDYASGSSRTLEILKTHVILPRSSLEWIFGSGEYLYGNNLTRANSDIGFIILLKFGGVIYLSGWLCLFVVIIRSATNNYWSAILSLVFIGALGSKGLVFSGNAVTYYFLVFFFVNKARHTALRTENWAA